MDPNEIAALLNNPELTDPRNLKYPSAEGTEAASVQAFIDNPEDDARWKDIMLITHPDKRNDSNSDYFKAAYFYRANESVQAEVRQKIDAIRNPKPAPTIPEPATPKPTAATSPEPATSKQPSATTTPPAAPPMPTNPTNPPNFAKAFEGVKAATEGQAKSATNLPSGGGTNSQTATPVQATPQFEQTRRQSAPPQTMNPSPTTKVLPLVLSPNQAIDTLFLSGLVEICKKNGCSIAIEMPFLEKNADFTKVAQRITEAFEFLQGQGAQVTIAPQLLDVLKKAAETNPACNALVTQYDEQLSPITPGPSHRL